MRCSSLLFFAAALGAHGSSAQESQPANAGYLAVAFTGKLEQVYFQIAPASKPQTFTTMNQGHPVVRATEGTERARDPFILKGQDGKLYVLATDLRIGTTTWDASQRRGSRAIHIWESTDGLQWSADRLVTLMPEDAGFVWAPSAIWNPEQNQYAVFWSSNVFDEDDPDHEGSADGPFIFYAHTPDFVEFSDPTIWETPEGIYIDQEIQPLGGNSFVRYLKDSKINKVYVERSDTGLFGRYKRLGLVSNAIREGPASFQDIENPERYYVWVDDYSGRGYECHYTEDWSTPFPKCATPLAPRGMRHGAVVQLDENMYNALMKWEEELQDNS